MRTETKISDDEIRQLLKAKCGEVVKHAFAVEVVAAKTVGVTRAAEEADDGR